MNRFLATLLVLATTTAGVAWADAAPMPSQGKKFVDTQTSVLLGKGVTGYTFYVGKPDGRGRPQAYTYAKAELDAEKPTAMPATARAGAWLVAVPDEEAKKYTAAKELEADIAAGKVPGQQRLPVAGQTEIAAADKRTKLVRTLVVTGVDAKKGIQTEEKTDDEKDGGKSAENGEQSRADEPGASWRFAVAGLAASLAVALGGLWAVRRFKRAG